ncbi:sensor domain-containing phosphodiesterase [Mycobacterium shigaense]|uniref:sensor domain-containing phosphodiesterase n=1 Tax=Mycobacterium shigaense TaxID=722731 RepID=UPI0013C33932|nr:EAL domain-containing protein [Mycobacterium shigaense]MEA1120732.1 EAL domain-containing protein [Mycobacterium shigaense]
MRISQIVVLEAGEVERLVQALTALTDPVSLMSRIAEQTCTLMPNADGAAVTLLHASDKTYVTVAGYGVLAAAPGFQVPQLSSLQGLAAREKRPKLIDDAQTDPRLSSAVRAANRHWDTRSWVLIPLMHNEDPIGSLLMVARAPNAFDITDVDLMLEIGEFVSALTYVIAGGDESGQHAITAHFATSVMLPEAVKAKGLNDRLDALLAQPEAVSAVFQPIVHLESGGTVAYEGLTRFPPSELTPTQWFSAARHLGRGLELEHLALCTILSAARRIPSEGPVAVNLSPSAALDPAIHELLITQDRAMIVEITEHEPFPDDLAAGLTWLRDRGIGLAVDDAGAGYASFTQLLRLRPDIIKIDGELTIGIDGDPAKRALVSALNTLATELHANTVAEAVETVSQLQTLAGLGVGYGQGFYLGRPRRNSRIRCHSCDFVTEFPKGS